MTNQWGLIQLLSCVSLVSLSLWMPCLAFGGSDIRHFYMMITAGYLAYDLVLCLRHFKTLGELTTLIHHVVILVAYSLGLFFHFGTFYMGFFLVNEISTPFLNIRWFLFMTGRQSGKLYDWNAYALTLTFFVSRVVLNLIAVEHMTRGFFRFYAELITRPGLPIGVLYFLPILAWTHVIINIYWFWLIFEKVLRKLGVLRGPRNPHKEHHHHKSHTGQDGAPPKARAANGTHTKKQD